MNAWQTISSMEMLHNILHQDTYKRANRQSAEFLKSSFLKSLSADEMTRMHDLRAEDLSLDKGKAIKQQAMRHAIARKMIGKQAADMYKAGVSTTTGFNFYDLRGPVSFLYPVNTPFRNRLPRIGRVNDGVGTAAHWQATRNPGFQYAGVPEGQRNAIGTPDNNNYVASYKELGGERAATFTSEFASEGFTDVLADEHIRGLHALFLQEEGMMLLGNSGTGFSGYALGTCPTPTGTVQASHTVGANGNLSVTGNADLPYTTIAANTNYLSVACVVLTGLGNPSNVQYGYGIPPTVGAGLVPQYSRNSAAGELTTVPGGMGAISAISAPVQVTTGNLTVKFIIPAASLPIKGAYGYAWFVDLETSNTGSLANAKLAGITSTPYCFVSGTATGTQTGTAANLSTDHSFSTLDFDGLLTYAASTSGAYWNDLSAGVVTGANTNNSLTSGKDGTVSEIETALAYIFNNYQAGVDNIWGSPDAILNLNKAVRYNGTTNSAYQFVTTRDEQNNLLGGWVVSAYQSKFAVNSPTGANAIPLRMHPMIPPGTLYFEVNTNPYPQSRAPWTCGMLVQREYYSIEWPVITRQWGFGTYTHEVLAHYMPWLTGAITSIGPFVGT